MNLNQFFKTLLILPICAVFLLGSTLIPVEEDKKEILNIGDKRRTYYQLHTETLNYTVTGPRTLEIIARKAVPRKLEDATDYGYFITLDENEPIEVTYKKKKSASINSPRHPGHSYTRSGTYNLTIPAGEHTLTLKPQQKRSSPVLIRIIVQTDHTVRGEGAFVTPVTREHPDHLIISDKSIRYFSLTAQSPIMLELDGPGRLEIISRLAFEDWMTDEAPYRLRVSIGDQVIGTYFFITEKSEVSLIQEDKARVPGKWRSCEFELQTGRKQYTVELLDPDKKVYIRALEYHDPEK
ncbi:MAG: hypothetical protein H8D46_00915 [FCB group bacterium]|nr:hypothetical protein [FCB group bacterium]